jgi:hypothetical protein
MILTQIAAVIRLEMTKTFLSRRGIWTYLLALAPVLLFFGHSFNEIRNNEQRAQWAAARKVPAAALKSIRVGMSLEDVELAVGEPHEKTSRRVNGRVVVYLYTDGSDVFRFVFVNDVITNVSVQERDTLAADSLVFATVFQFFYLRLAVFFGCVGVFTNLFRGELVQKSLHFYLLTPMRREVLMIGKYLSGLIATTVIFCTSTMLQIAALAWHIDSKEMATFLAGGGWGQAASYVGVTAAACVGYGSVFLAAGLLFRNPIMPAAFVLAWEGANIFLPSTLKHISVIFYLQSLCPVIAPPEADIPRLLRYLITSSEPAGAAVAILGLLGVTTALLFLAGRLARRLEINYSAD